MRFAEKLKTLREDRNLSQADVASSVGVHQSRVSRWENGEGEPDRFQLLRLARMFEVVVDFLADDEKDKPDWDLTPAERQALKMVRELQLGEGEVIRRLAGQAASSRPPTTSDIEVKPRPRPEDSLPPNHGGQASPRRRGPRTG